MRRAGLVRAAGMALGLPALTLGVVAGLHLLRGSPAAPRPAVDVAHLAAAPGTATETAATGPATTCRPEPAMIGTVAVPGVAARLAPRASAPVVATFTPRSVEGGPQVFLLESAVRGGTWYRALLPVRPNGTTGYLPARALSLSRTRYSVVIDRARFLLQLWKGCRLVRTYPVGVGTARTPTPAGSFYVAALVQPPTRDSVYGAWAYGLSGYSNVVRSWRWGGVIGLHGTNQPASVGRRSSHGCIRLLDRDISQLVRLLPLGTPVTIR